jgi:hypothetical protein
VAEQRLPLLIERDGGRAADDAVIVLGLLDLAASGAWSLRRTGLRRRWQMRRLGSPPPDDHALTALDVALKPAPTENGAVPIAALGWWMKHAGVAATRVRDAARDDLEARRAPAHDALPPRPGRHAEDVDVALGGFPATGDEYDFVTRLLRARDKPTGPVDDVQARPSAGLGSSLLGGGGF